MASNAYITLHTVKRALASSMATDVFKRQAAISSNQPGIHQRKWIDAEHRQLPKP